MIPNVAELPTSPDFILPRPDLTEGFIPWRIVGESLTLPGTDIHHDPIGGSNTPTIPNIQVASDRPEVYFN